jgi:hypothetical protein
MTSLFWLLVGAFVGWNVPQPKWAVDAKAKVVAFVKGLFVK